MHILYSLDQKLGHLLIKINLQTRLLNVTRLVNEADIVNKTRPLFTLSLEMTRLVNETRLLIQYVEWGQSRPSLHRNMQQLVCPLGC